MINVQARIKDLMKQRKWTEYRLAKESGLGQSTISNLFDRSTSPTIPTLQAICSAFNMSLSQFFASEGELITLTIEQKEYLEVLSTISDEQRELLLKLIKTMI